MCKHMADTGDDTSGRENTDDKHVDAELDYDRQPQLGPMARPYQFEPMRTDPQVQPCRHPSEEDQWMAENVWRLDSFCHWPDKC